MSIEPSAVSRPWARAVPWKTLASSRFVLPAILLLAFAVYAPTLNDWFFGDDFWFLRSATSIPFGEYAVDSLDYRQTGTLYEFDRYRPLYPIVWRLQYEVFGLNAVGYHAVLLALHLGCVSLVWLIARRLTKQAWAAGLAALIFAFHPAYTDAVAWVSGGNRVFATFPYLLSLFLFMAYVDATQRRAALYAGSVLAFVTAVLLHSTALTLAVVLPAYAFLVATPLDDALRPRSWLQFAPFAAVCAVLIGIQAWVRGNLDVEEQFRFGFHQYASYGRYLGVALVPTFRLDPDGLGDTLRRIEQVGSLVMVLITIALLRQRQWPFLGIFAAVWFFVALLPDSTLVFSTQGRLLYLPGAGLAILFVVALSQLNAVLPNRVVGLAIRVAPALVVAVLIPAILLTLHYEQVQDDAAAESERFVQALRATHPTLAEGSTLYVANAPFGLRLFGDTYLVSAVQTFYGGVRTHGVTIAQAETLQSGGAVVLEGQTFTLEQGDHVFRYAAGAR